MVRLLLQFGADVNIFAEVRISIFLVFSIALDVLLVDCAGYLQVIAYFRLSARFVDDWSQNPFLW